MALELAHGACGWPGIGGGEDSSRRVVGELRSVPWALSRVAGRVRPRYDALMQTFDRWPAVLARCAVALLLALGGCDGAGDARTPLVVLAAASLTAPFTAIEAEFEAAHPGHDVRLQLDGSQNLAFQLEQGAKADVFASADEPNMRRVVGKGLVHAEPVTFATNGLAIAVQKGNPKNVRGIHDLARKDLRVALCGPTVPVGGYARTALGKAGVEAKPVSEETNVRALVGKVRLGEVDAAIVYATDVTGDALEPVAIAKEHDVRASYPIAVLRDAPNDDAAAAFVAFVRGDAGKRILKAHGFSLP